MTVVAPPPLTKEIEQQLRQYPKEDVVDGCTAAAHVAYACSDAAFIYPITPSSAMAEIYEVWAAHGRRNVYGDICVVKQLQSEAGAAGAVHGSLSAGAVTTTFTASQGLLLMIPPMYKIAGELIPCVFHVSARAIAGQALSIFGDHSDVMAVRQCGWAMLSSASVQEAQDMAVISHMATLHAKVPFVHFFDGFRTSHELSKIKMIDYGVIRELLDFSAIQDFRKRSLNPTHPYTKGASQGPEVYFQNIELSNKYYNAVPDILQQCFEAFGQKTGRYYLPFEYYGAEDAEDVIVIMGAGGPVVEETIDWLRTTRNDKAGLITVKLFRPWRLELFTKMIPKSCKRICVMDRTKEAGALGEPLFLDVAASLTAAGLSHIKCIGGRFGLGSKDFHPSMVVGVLDNLRSENPKHGFCIGIIDDVTHNSIPYPEHDLHIDTVPVGTTQCMFWGMGSDGTVGANKNVIKIIGMNTDLYVQGYFAYSAHKAGGLTVSHLRFGPEPIKSQYLLQSSDYVAVHRALYIQKYDCLKSLRHGGTFVLNTSWTLDELEKELPDRVKRFIAENDIHFYTIDANKVAVENGMGRRINNVLMTAFFKLSGVLPMDQAIGLFKKAIQKTYGKKGQHVVDANWKCVDAAIDAVHEIPYPKDCWRAANTAEKEMSWTNSAHIQEPPTFVKGVMQALERMEGDSLPTSAFAEFAGGVIPPGTAGYEKRAIALNVPVVDMDKCTQCNQCSFVCPHAAIRPFLVDDDEAERAPGTFVMKKAKGFANIAGYKYRIQVSPYDCTGCELCYIACPDDALKMIPLEKAEGEEEPNWNFAINLKDRSDELEENERLTLKGSQFYQPMVEFSGACEGCGETPYVKLLTQLFGERLIIANATGCSSIWAASYPANAYTVNQKGYGPAWGNSLFEDNAEYGYGMVVATDTRRQRLSELVKQALEDETFTSAISSDLRSYLSEWLLNWDSNANSCQKVYEKIGQLLEKEKDSHAYVKAIYEDRDMLPKISQWIIGGDGWAYDIGFGGLDHVLASGANVNVLILDTEVYSNTGGQQSKATTMGAVHKFATNGRIRHKKDMGFMCMEYGDVYVASVASSANMTQTIRAFIEAEQFTGPSVIMAYSPCIEHQYIKPFNLQIEHCKFAVDSGYWPLYRYNPDLPRGKQLQLDSRKIKASIVDLMKKENRFGSMRRTNPALAAVFEQKLQEWAHERFEKLRIKSLGPAAYAGSGTGEAGGEGGVDKECWNVLYGTETGHSEEVARRLCDILKGRNQKVNIYQMDECSLEDVMNTMRRLLIVCSTAGQGELPPNAKALYEEMEKQAAESKSGDSETALPLKDHEFCVMGLGDSAYVFFNEAAKKFDSILEKLGARRMMDLGLGDDQAEDGYESALGEWIGNLVTECKLPEPLDQSEDPPLSVFEVKEVDASEKAKHTYTACQPHGFKPVKMVFNDRITPSDYEVDIRHLEFDLSGSGTRYALGDSLAIWPQNDEKLVEEVCEYFGWDPEMLVKIDVAKNEDGSVRSVVPQKVVKLLCSNTMSVKQLLVECLDVFGKPKRTFYESLWRYCEDPKEKEAAKVILNKENRENLLHWTNKEYVNNFDVLKKFKSVKLSLERFLDLTPLITPRYYSIASSQKFVGQNKLQLCIGVVDWKRQRLGTEAAAAGEEVRFGLATGFVRRAQPPLSVMTAIKPTAFNLPPTEEHPILVAGMGTGLAPFRSFIQHRAYVKNTLNKPIGPLVVYFGCRYSKKDWLYRDEMLAYKEEGVISNLKLAFSRDQKEKHYIQHEILRDPGLFYDMMMKKDGYFYLCGSAKQVPIDIRNAVRATLCKEGSMDEVEAEKVITDWQIKGRYNVEAW